MIVLDASAALVGLAHDGAARAAMGIESLNAPHLIDAEIANGLRRQVGRGAIPATQARTRIAVWAGLGIARHPMTDLLGRMWELRDNVSAYDAAYVALAEKLGCTLVTADRRLSRAAGVRCSVTTVPS
jgi:predicted nucleic acid-binding protein